MTSSSKTLALASQPRALVVDDDPIIRAFARRALTSQGFHCEVAVDGMDATAKLNAAHFDLLLTDLHMPNLNGHALAMRVMENSARPVVAILTGVLEPRLTKDLLLRGVDEISFKPVDFQLLATKLRALVDRRGKGAAPKRGDGREASIQEGAVGSVPAPPGASS